MKQHISILIGAALLLAASSADARPRGTYEVAPSQAALHGGSGYKTIYLNRNGGTYYPANYNDAATNRSTIPSSTSSIAPFEGTNAQWNELVSCVRYQFARYDVTITTNDPSPSDHIEAVVGGSPGDVGREPNVGGVAPFACSPMSSAVVFNFSTIYGNNMEQLCFTVAQEVGHAYGLDHQMMCEDPMTYLNGCGFKTFQNASAPCGEDQNRGCRCGGSTQNSHNYLRSWLGSRPDNANPSVNITSPSGTGAGANAQIGFTATVSASDDVAIERVEFHLDNVKVGEARFGPYSFPTSPAIGLGVHRLDAHAWDAFGKHSVDTVMVTVTADGNPAECFQDSECEPNWVCYNLKCYDQTVLDLGEIGESCTENADCYSAMCGNDGVDQFCTEDCTATMMCPDGTTCRDAGGGFSVCWPGGGGGGGDGGGDSGGCSTSDTAGLAGGAWVFLLLGIIGVIRRRRHN